MELKQSQFDYIGMLDVLQFDHSEASNRSREDYLKEAHIGKQGSKVYMRKLNGQTSIWLDLTENEMKVVKEKSGLGPDKMQIVRGGYVHLNYMSDLKSVAIHVFRMYYKHFIRVVYDHYGRFHRCEIDGNCVDKASCFSLLKYDVNGRKNMSEIIDVFEAENTDYLVRKSEKLID